MVYVRFVFIHKYGRRLIIPMVSRKSRLETVEFFSLTGNIVLFSAQV